MRKTFEIPLDIPEVTIEQVETDSHGDFVITVKSTVEGTRCHQCGKKITKVYGYDREITLRHLSILGRKTYIRRSFWIPGSWHLRMGYTDAIPFRDPSQESNRAG